MTILSTSDADIAIAAAALRSGKLVALPTETVYGLGASARDSLALARVFAAKRRPAFDPLIVHVASPEEADQVADMSLPWAKEAARRFWPGPLTLVLPKRDWVPDLATSGLATVALRCPGLDLTRRIIAEAGVPVAAPSANLFGQLSPTTAGHVAAGLAEAVDYIVDGGPCRYGVESTVLDLSMDPPLVLRPGGLSLEELRRVIPGVQLFDRSTTSPRAPGQLPSHYAPAKPLRLFPAGSLPAALVERRGDACLALVCFGKRSAVAIEAAIKGGASPASLHDLSPAADPVEAAAALFSLLHRLDAGDCTEIWAERLPDDGLGLAVNDRLYKASVKPEAESGPDHG